ncbi:MULTISPECIES: YceI family protein [Tatumella]|uniref:YceI family protein n=1 Tax=Tatumella punctata TaxID=399969 RepID=A0ABW1VSA9_9GAMM|nr:MULTISPECIES: YceI family protein [unclassified Tatumella]MBS0856767.1 YceI family protein [Tatumella sp. JGM16]MBS0894427.1 YceI family protein [Tatumella sp. JGM130]MBS0913277.1 YceI family protein [Tatumella sp. JGM91]
MSPAIKLLVMIVACLPLAGVAGQYLINPQLSHLELYWQMIGVREYHARLSAVQGEINFDQQQDSQIRLQARLPIAALDANNWLLTRALKSAAFFDQEKYPEAVFSSNRMVALPDGRYRVFGSLQIKNVRKSLILFAQQRRVSAQRIRLSAQTTLSRRSFAMGQYPVIVSDPIRVDIVLYADSTGG